MKNAQDTKSYVNLSPARNARDVIQASCLFSSTRHPCLVGERAGWEACATGHAGSMSYYQYQSASFVIFVSFVVIKEIRARANRRAAHRSCNCRRI